MAIRYYHIKLTLQYELQYTRLDVILCHSFSTSSIAPSREFTSARQCVIDAIDYAVYILGQEKEQTETHASRHQAAVPRSILAQTQQGASNHRRQCQERCHAYTTIRTPPMRGCLPKAFEHRLSKTWRKNHFPFACCHKACRAEARVLGRWLLVLITCCTSIKSEAGRPYAVKDDRRVDKTA